MLVKVILTATTTAVIVRSMIITAIFVIVVVGMIMFTHKLHLFEID